MRRYNMPAMRAVRSFSCPVPNRDIVRFVKAGLIAASIDLYGCATPSERFAESALDRGFHEQTIDSGSHFHRLYANRPAQTAEHYAELHVYLDGDGTPWTMHRWISDDPTPRNPLILELMALDKKPSILLGRPCYYGLSKSKHCHSQLWTSHRYSETVVTGMAHALRSWLTGRRVDKLTLIGFSGGGALAMLLAPRFEQTAMIVTIAANLDVAAWSRHHGYQPLTDSLNPVDAPPLPETIEQIHLAGLDDRNVPPAIIESFSQRETNARYLPFAEQTHACCWADIWPGILTRYIDLPRNDKNR